jgi:DNA-binding transcriptional regulator PaaX
MQSAQKKRSNKTKIKSEELTDKSGGSSHGASMAKRIAREENIEFAKDVAGVALGVIGAIGLSTILIVAPNILKGLNGLYKTGKIIFKDKNSEEKRVQQTLYYLKRKGLISFRSSKKGILVALTGKGRERLVKLQAVPMKIAIPAKWDGKWWLVASDVPTISHRPGSELLRKKLKHLGFYPFQRSLWLYPYDPRSELQWIVEHFKIAHFVTIIEASRLDEQDEASARKHFKEVGLHL